MSIALLEPNYYSLLKKILIRDYVDEKYTEVLKSAGFEVNIRTDLLVEED